VQRVGDGVGWCEHCRLHVHDLSAGTELEARALLRTHGRQRLCASYRTDDDGAIVFRETARRWASASAIALLVACAGHAPIDEAPELVCRDADGREQHCPAPVEPVPTIPPAAPEPEAKAAASGAGVPIQHELGGSFGVDDEDVWGGIVGQEAAGSSTGGSRRVRRSAKPSPAKPSAAKPSATDVDGRALADSLWEGKSSRPRGPLGRGGIVCQGDCAPGEEPQGL
jgi:hypothetical protein